MLSSNKRWDKTLKTMNECYVCGKYIPLFGGKFVHKGLCSRTYATAYAAYLREKNSA